MGVAAAPASASRAGCLAKAKHTRDVVAESTKAIVFKDGSAYKGCSYDREKTHKLDGQKGGERITRSTVHVKGRYAAYATKTGGDLYVYSVALRRGHTFGTSKGSGVGEGLVLDKIVMRADGSTAWQFDYPPAAWTAVWKIDRAGPGQLDRDDDDGYGRAHRIEHGSLSLSHGVVSWHRIGEAELRHYAFQ
jgi:hypothetical protein